jgi:hypothetical protein
MDCLAVLTKTIKGIDSTEHLTPPMVMTNDATIEKKD